MEINYGNAIGKKGGPAYVVNLALHSKIIDTHYSLAISPLGIYCIKYLYMCTERQVQR